MARVGITFEDLLKASMASLHVEQKETIKNIVVLVKNANILLLYTTNFQIMHQSIELQSRAWPSEIFTEGYVNSNNLYLGFSKVRPPKLIGVLK